MSCNDERESVKKKYDSIRVQCGLPEIGEFELEFGRIVEEPVVSTILLMIADGLGRHLSHIESVFTPTRISDNIEAEFYSDKDMSLLYKAYKEMICAYHDINIGFLKSEKEMLEYVKRNYALWKTKFKPYLLKLLSEQTEKWKKEAEKVEKPHSKSGSYHG